MTIDATVIEVKGNSPKGNDKKVSVICSILEHSNFSCFNSVVDEMQSLAAASRWNGRCGAFDLVVKTLILEEFASY